MPHIHRNGLLAGVDGLQSRSDLVGWDGIPVSPPGILISLETTHDSASSTQQILFRRR